MSEVSQEQLAHEVHAGPVRLVIAVTGGGSGAIPALLGVAGASRSILAATVPYASQALVEWLGAQPDEFCSARTARAMAMAAYLKARAYDPSSRSGGVGCTASLASDRPKHGPHRVHVAYQTADTTATHSLQFEKGARSRADEESLTARLVLNMVAEACGTEGRVAMPLRAGEKIETTRVVASPERQDLLAGRLRAVPAHGPATRAKPRAVLPGAFHPLHEGHRKMAAAAARILGRDIDFELSIVNVDKPPLDYFEIEERVSQFSATQEVWLTRAPYFIEKSELFPGATFVVGADTIARVGQPRYYNASQDAMHAAIAKIVSLDCRFLVFGRVVEGTFRTLADLRIPAELAAICREVPESDFRDDISSTEIRRSQTVE